LLALTAVPPRAASGIGSRLRAAIRFVDEYTSPRDGTAGNFEHPSFFQGTFNGGADGFYLFGLSGVLTGAGAAGCGIAVQRWTGSQVAGVVAGTLVGAALGVGASVVLGHGMTPASAVGGALLGGFETLRGDSRAVNRDANNLLSAFFMSGPAKMAAPLGSMIGMHCKTTSSRMIVGGLTGAALGAAVAAAFPSGTGVAAAAAISGLCGMVGPFFGPRLSQLLRNAAQDVGKGLSWVGQKLGHAPSTTPKGPPSKLMTVVGTVPVAFCREGIRAFFISGGSLQSVIVGGLKESVQQIQIVVSAKPEARHPQTGTPPASNAA
jgi:hypothetical protein